MRFVNVMTAVGSFCNGGLTLNIYQTLISFPLKSLTIKQHGDNGVMVAIKISLLPSIKWVVKRQCGGWRELR